MMFRSVALSAFLAGVAASQSCGTLPATISYSGNAIKLPDPFTFLNGTKVTTEAQWRCRREEISALIQRYELGPMPAAPDVKASFSSNKLTITVTANGKSLTMSPTIKLPSSGTAPFPALIALGGASIPVPANVALITYNNEEIAATDPRGKGKFFDLYGSSSTTGGLVAWAWGASRIMDALEQLGSATTKIDAKRVAVTGCSRNGKGAMVAGAFDERIRLTIPQEGGSGAMGCWRIVGEMKKNGTKTEDAAQIVNGDQWFATEFSKYVNALDKLPHDHHMLAAMIAPRPFLVIENSGIDYLGPISSYGCATAARMVYGALGAPDGVMGFSQNAHGSSHCQLPSAQNGDVAAYFNKFLLGQESVDTKIWKPDSKLSLDIKRYVDWTAPKLV
ncbi:Glucuronoyl esterase catalytic domain from Hypocrea Jecorina [Apodospora peruviana]|uniref:(4-O-methyl)-D-glucuronate--lignin esterase n=1 Tax=Apodospora peruviana TaxID=516989 RepID=A0AAE0HTE9_9PEZI|nr:Glucuronoyl esterase catalytic domain from Hypocrea Jecorina [Apodospora peruviana]